MLGGFVRVLVQAGTPTPTGTPTRTPTESAAETVGQFLPPWVPEWAVQGALALLVVVLSYYVSKVVRQVFGRRIARRFQRPSLTRTVLRSIQTTILLLGGGLALRILGVPLQNLALSVTVFSAVAGFVLAPIIGSVINGLFVLSEQPYEIGDMIHLSDREVYGFVEDITLRYTKVFTLDNTFLVIPNGSIRERDVVNYSAEDGRTRLKLDVQVTYESDLDEARALIEEAAAHVDKVIEGGPDIRIGSARYPARPTCYIDAFADHGVNLRLRYWATEPYKLLKLRSEVQTAIWDRLEEADVEIAYPHSHLYFDDTSGEMQVSVRDRGPELGPERPPGVDGDERRD
ncbi:mechanosensitive ion channel family protein [Salinirubellus salinus]|uniref:Mechanosensitive ion channel family protein n=1 Tax=Salinirubellus salinus TaxID=1364945 RepID=A0A9E7UCI1_9EURY|nr:mechanosensitive ion channel family protein [Salinirubellus salinus]UWM56283.1 mechanosensitive ion channel family protein [Salinirubellus salinus]